MWAVAMSIVLKVKGYRPMAQNLCQGGLSEAEAARGLLIRPHPSGKIGVSLRYPPGGTEMDDEDFLWAIAENPDDAGPRLVYADWLEERGDPRSEYLRVEAGLRSTPLGDPGRRQVGRRY